MKKQSLISIVMLALLYFVSSTIGSAQTSTPVPGSLDNCFGSGGIQIITIPNGSNVLTIAETSRRRTEKFFRCICIRPKQL